MFCVSELRRPSDCYQVAEVALRYVSIIAAVAAGVLLGLHWQGEGVELGELSIAQEAVAVGAATAVIIAITTIMLSFLIKEFRHFLAETNGRSHSETSGH